MPDTGAPWNIPYVSGTDLVADWPGDSLSLANAVAAGLDAATDAGIGSNVVQTFKDDTFTTTSATFVPVTGLTATITPTSATSKVLVLATVTIGNGTNDFGGRLNIVRTATAIAQPSGGAAPGTFTYTVSSNNNATNGAMVFLDSPATASAVTYSIEIAGYGTYTYYVNRSNNADRTGTSSLTLIEVAV